MAKIGIRREDKHQWEARVPLTPEAVRGLVHDQGLELVVQPSPIRAFPEEEFRKAGAVVQEDLSGCDVVFAVKEIPMELLRKGGAYVFFSHTIKGQPYNMPLLQRLLDLDCTLMDYERIVDDQGRRLVFFGQHAGLAGMIDTFHVLGKRLASQGLDTPFLEIKLAHQYRGLDEAKSAFETLRRKLQANPLPGELQPFVVGVAGYGSVSKGAQEMLDLLQPTAVDPDDLGDLKGSGVHTVVFEERHLVEPVEQGAAFVLQDYYDNPSRYRSVFERHVRHLDVLINAIYWTEDYPRLLTLDFLKRWFASEPQPRLRIVGDISCDIDGSVECTVKPTTPGEPAYVYEPTSGKVTDGVDGPGLCMMTTDCLPCELPVEASESFTRALLPFVAATAGADYSGTLDAAGLPGPMKAATIVWRGELAPDYRYLEEYLG